MQVIALEELEKKVNEARARNEQLKKIKQAKIDLLKLRLGNKFAGFAAKHPYLTTAAEQAGRSGLELGRTAGQVGVRLAKAAYRAGKPQRKKGLYVYDQNGNLIRYKNKKKRKGNNKEIRLVFG